MTKSADSQELGGFEQRLLGELTAVVTERAAAAPAPVRQRARWQRPAAAVGATAAFGTALALIFPVLTHSPASQAYAVEVGRGGTVTVTLHDMAGLKLVSAREDLHRKLLAAGIPNSVAEVGPFCITGSHDTPGFMENRKHSIVLHPDRLPAADELLVGVQRDGGADGDFNVAFTEVRTDRHKCPGAESKPTAAPTYPPGSAARRKADWLATQGRK
ncbi:hypothetical protein [Actinacidiphila acididurans]|uniref:Anti-sigma factor n=1 Tax=Actinacidiphila acididurans TaxID=2784346 RepID=A0ABS2TTK3_9ACTN|nr:hypothetical protein [Actinacidiphila acididurans]MBM9506664.1 hypothetical protein [Actinacidiphila acididurans]